MSENQAIQEGKQKFGCYTLFTVGDMLSIDIGKDTIIRGDRDAMRNWLVQALEEKTSDIFIGAFRHVTFKKSGILTPQGDKYITDINYVK